VVLCGVLGLFIIEEPDKQTEKDGYFKNIIYSFKPSTIKQNLSLYLTTLTFAVFCISIQVFMPYLIIYYEVALKLTNYVLIMAPAIVIAGIITAIYGRYYDKVGFVGSVIPSIVCLMVGYVLLAIFTNVILVFIGSLLMMTGYLTGMAVFGAMIRDNTPIGKAGSFQGIRIVGQVLIPGIIGPIIGAWVLRNAEVMIGSDGTESFIPNQNIFIAALVVAVVAIALVYLIHLYQVRQKNSGKDYN
jgi:MFS family permease